MYFKCLILLTISQIISGAAITGKRTATFSGTELKQICKSIRDDLNDGINPDKAVGSIVQQFETKLGSEVGSRLTKFKGLLKTFKAVIEIVENGKLKDLSTNKQDSESNESSQSADNVADDQPDSGDNEPIKENDTIDNPNDTVNPDNSDNEIDSGSIDGNEANTEFDSNDTDEYDICELIVYPDWIDLDEIDYSEIYGYDYGDYGDYDDYDDTPYEYEYQFEPFGLKLNLHLSISD